MIEFFCCGKIDRLIQGKKVYVTIREGGEKKQVQKHFILCNLKAVYSFFKKAEPNLTLGFSKFAALRPRNCVLPEAPCTHSVCVCTIHQNMQFLIEGAHPNAVTKDSSSCIENCKDIIHIAICKEAEEKCLFGQCFFCRNIQKVTDVLQAAFDENLIGDIQYKQ